MSRWAKGGVGFVNLDQFAQVAVEMQTNGEWKIVGWTPTAERFALGTLHAESREKADDALRHWLAYRYGGIVVP